MNDETLSWQSRVRLVDEVFDFLRERIYSGRYSPGESLPQVKIAGELSISRTPLREAFRMLEKEGLVKVGANGTVRVVSADLQSLLDAYELREVIDGLAARLAAERGYAEAAAQLEPLLAEQRRSLDPWMANQYTRANVQFHAAIFALAGNEFLHGQMPIVRMTAQVFTPKALLSKERVYSAISEHEGVVEAIKSGDGPRAEALARRHIRHSITSLREAGAGAAGAEAAGSARIQGRKRT